MQPTAAPTPAPTATATGTHSPPTLTTHPDFTPPASPIAHFTIPEANGVALAAGVAYVTSEAGLHLFDITEPAQPSVIGFYAAGGAGGVAQADHIACVLVGGKLHMVDVSDPSAPARVGLYELPDRLIGLA